MKRIVKISMLCLAVIWTFPALGQHEAVEAIFGDRYRLSLIKNLDQCERLVLTVTKGIRVLDTSAAGYRRIGGQEYLGLNLTIYPQDGHGNAYHGTFVFSKQISDKFDKTAMLNVVSLLPMNEIFALPENEFKKILIPYKP